MKILITGITGRIGGNLAAQLVEQGHRVRGLVWREDQRVEKFKGIDLELIEGNLTKYEDVQKVTDGVDVIYHLGAAFQGGGPFTGQRLLRDQPARHISHAQSRNPTAQPQTIHLCKHRRALRQIST